MQIFSPSTKSSREAERIGYAALAFLVRIVKAKQIEILGVRQQSRRIAQIFLPGDYDDGSNARVHESWLG